MSLINVMKKASLSRVTGGLILLRVGLPILSKDLHRYIDEVKQREGNRSNFYHLDEETCTLTHYTRGYNGVYVVTDVEVVSLAYLSEIQLKYEEMSGTDLKMLRYRNPTFFSDDRTL